MAKGKKTFIFYSDWINMIREMDNEDAGELLKHILSYVNDENPDTNNKFVKMAFGHMKPLIKKDLIKWEQQILKYSEMGKESARKRKEQHNSTYVEPMSTYVEPMNTVNDNVNVINTNSIYLEKEFLEDWKKVRLHFHKVPTNIKKLKTFESSCFDSAIKDFSKEDIRNAMQCLFKQEVQDIKSMFLQPRHFLENVEKYHNAHISKEYKLYGSKKIKYEL